eukprot:TRINITY_DN3047_c1_g1_i6.p1 TRINITY_DN3047_c1_g1~~TRINITY_DN3047_c1_g1_i6.p1  ORF type:complete len:226 (+),score=5.96 TRINITY_DN3047_c1_g1_i6:213-890(+)
MKFFKSSLGTSPLVYRRPLTVEVLNQLMASLDLSDFDTSVYATMLVVGVYCLLRIGEVCTTTSGGVQKTILNRDLKFCSGYVEMLLWGTKTDLEKHGVKKWICDIKAPFNPYAMVIRLKAMKVDCARPEDPFFVLNSGKLISKHLLVSFLQRQMLKLFPKVDSREWSGISLRKGGATSALRAGVSGVIIQRMGNWKSDVYKGYVDHAFIDVAGAQNLMANTMSSK